VAALWLPDLDFKAALAAFLQVKPKPNEEMDTAIKQKEKKETKTSDWAGFCFQLDTRSLFR